MSVHIDILHHECGCWEIKDLGMSFMCSTHGSLTTTYDQSLGRKGKAELQVRDGQTVVVSEIYTTVADVHRRAEQLRLDRLAHMCDTTNHDEPRS